MWKIIIYIISISLLTISSTDASSICENSLSWYKTSNSIVKYYEYWVNKNVFSLEWVNYNNFKQIDLVNNNEIRLLHDIWAEQCNFYFWIDEKFLFYKGQKILGVSAQEFNSDIFRYITLDINDYKLEPLSKSQLLEISNTNNKETSTEILTYQIILLYIFIWIIIGVILLSYKK
jgi:hypothetical protein